MWAFCSFLRRSNPLVTSCLRPVRRHDPTHTTVLGWSLIAPTRRPFSNEATTDLHQAAGKRHLYLVLDDHKKDYGIYKLDVDADLLDGDVGSDSTTAPRRLPRPALIRLEVTNEKASAQFAAAGGCIVAIGLSPYESLAHSVDYGIVTNLYDVKRAALYVSLHPTVNLQDGCAVAEPVGKRLYVFDLHTCSDDDSFHCMTTAKDDEDEAADSEVKQRDWGWWYNCGSSRIGWSDSCKAGYSSEQLPFNIHEIQGHAVHPRDCTIFLSAPVSYGLPSGAGWRYGVDTFIYHTTGDIYGWRRYGRWALPFKGHAHYDRQLNLWVGLHVDDERGDRTNGYLAACHIPSSEHKEPDRISSMEKIRLDDPQGRRLDLKLVYMGERGEYCLFERLGEGLGDGEECVLRLTTFRLKYEHDEPGYLRILDRRARSYKVSRYRDDFEAQAFWI